MYRKAMIPAVAVLILALAVPLHAEQASSSEPRGKGYAAAILGDLTPEQQKQTSALRLEFLKKQEALRAQMGTKRIELLELAGKEPVDEQALAKKRQEIWALQDQMRNERRELSTKLRAVLTPDQRQKVGPFGPGLGMGHKGCFGHKRGCCGHAAFGKWGKGPASPEGSTQM
jgi:Spy/CpxP family protein refolding chaperone